MQSLPKVLPALCSLAIVAVTAGCTATSFEASDPHGSSSRFPSERVTFQLGETSPPQKSVLQRSLGAAYTVTPTTVGLGSVGDVKKTGLEEAQGHGPHVPVYVWTTITHLSGKPTAVGDIVGDLMVRTTDGRRTKEPILTMGSAQWPDCPATKSSSVMASGQSLRVCTPFLIPEGQQPTAVELSQGVMKGPLEWLVK